jgi:hypothetical protein
MDDSLIAIGDAGTRRHGDAETRRHGEFAVSPLRRVTASPLRLIALLIIMLALSGCAAPVRVEWTTETEMNTAGFNLYRGVSADGPFDVKVNAQLIPPAADPLTGGKYQYVDQTARAGVTYYYRLEEVERNGSANNFGPISVRAGGLEWWHVLILALLGVGVAALWILGRKRATAPRTTGQDRTDVSGDQKS